jgi:IS30 family transposase
MTNEQKEKIAELRSTGVSYAKIGEALGLNKDTVKTYCRRNNLQVINSMPMTDTAPMFCRECGKPLIQKEKHKRRVFCSRECREKWWHSHPEQLNKKAVYEFQCAGCGRSFSAYGNSHRKYCSFDCYIKSRFKGGESNE